MTLSDQQVATKIAKARALKAIHLADALGRAGCDAATARNLDGTGRRAAEKAAQVRQASEDTWSVVFSIMERREQSSREEADENERQLLRA